MSLVWYGVLWRIKARLYPGADRRHPGLHYSTVSRIVTRLVNASSRNKT